MGRIIVGIQLLNQLLLLVLLLIVVSLDAKFEAKQVDAQQQIIAAPDGLQLVSRKSSSTASDKVKSPPPLIPRQLLEGNEDVRQVKLSHDGKWLAYLAPYNGVMNIWARNLESTPTASPIDDEISAEPRRYDRLLTTEQDRGIQGFMWAYTNEHLMYLLDRNGDENWRLFRLSVNTGISEPLIDMEGVQAQILAVSHKFPNIWIIGLNNRDPRYHDPYRFNIITGQREKIFENNRFKSIRFDNDLNLRLVEEDKLLGGSFYYVPVNQSNGNHNLSWKLYRTVRREDSELTKPLRFDPTNTKLYWQDVTDSDMVSLVLVDFEQPSNRTVLHRPLKSDVEMVLFHPILCKPVLLYENYLKRETIILDDSLRSDLEIVKTFAPEEAMSSVESLALDFTKWIIMIDSDKLPPKYYLFDRRTKFVQFLFSQRKGLLQYTLAKMYPLEIVTRDKKTQVCFLTLPVEADVLGVGRPPKPIPMVVSVHGGPWARDSWGFNTEAQLHANRGYATLSCNYRGSMGYGSAYLNAGNGEWGGKMQTDLLDSVDWAIRQGIADANRVAISGASYGGYAALAGLTMSPLVFACGVDLVGPSNLITLVKSVPPYWRPIYESMKYRIGGDPEVAAGREFLKSRSPLTFANQIQRPLMIAQGANDPRVKQAESDQIVRAMKAHKIPVTYLLFPDEGHGWQRQANRRAFTAVMEIFLADCLGGRTEPIHPDDFKESSLKVVENGGLSLPQHVIETDTITRSNADRITTFSRRALTMTIFFTCIVLRFCS